MVAGIFRSNQPAVLFLVPLVVLGLFLPDLGHGAVSRPGLMPLAAAMERLLGNVGWLRQSFGMLLVLAVAVQAALLVNGLELMDRRNHLVAVLFPLLMAGLSGPVLYEPALLGMPLVLLAFRRVWAMGNTGHVLGVVFDAGFLLGLASLCYLPYAFLLVVIWASVSVVRPFAWREYVLPVLAFATVFYLAWAGLRLAGSVPWRPLLTVLRSDPAAAAVMGGSPMRTSFLIVVGTLLLFALMAFGNSYARTIMRGKNLRSSFMAFVTALVVLLLFLSAISGGFPPVLMAVPAAVLCAHALLAPRKPWLAEAAALVLVVVGFWIRWSG
jgi:hypothetical protein